jgi:hypothetical protein
MMIKNGTYNSNEISEVFEAVVNQTLTKMNQKEMVSVQSKGESGTPFENQPFNRSFTLEEPKDIRELTKNLYQEDLDYTVSSGEDYIKIEADGYSHSAYYSEVVTIRFSKAAVEDDKFPIDLSNTDEFKSLFSNPDGLYGGRNSEGEEVMILKDETGLTLKTFQKNGWIQVSEYDTEGIKTDDYIGGRHEIKEKE